MSRAAGFITTCAPRGFTPTHCMSPHSCGLLMLGASIAYNVNALPAFSLWKNMDTDAQGYVTGMEPGTSFSYNQVPA